jgi:phage terminase large subunit
MSQRPIKPTTDKLTRRIAETSITKEKKLRKVGRPSSPKKDKQLDLKILKQAMLLDNVEHRIEEQQQVLQSGIKELTIPYTPSIHQQEVHKLLDSHRFGVVVVHRGWGKTWLAANELIRRAWACAAPQGGKFIYVAPEKLQAKKIVWKELKFFVKDLPHTANEAELTITFPNGSSIELAGADNPDRLRGQHPHFVVLDEVAQMPRDIWYEAVYPGLRANQGGALFIGTPKGDNLFKELFEHGKTAKGWVSYMKTIFDTSVATKEEIEDLRLTMPLPKFEQEYLCSFSAAIQGTYFGPIIDDAGRGIVADVPIDPATPIITAWDLGTTDSTVIWFVQKDKHDSRIIRIVDYYENSEKDVFHYIAVIKNKGYSYDHHIMPHDVTQVSWETGRTRLDLFRQHGLTIKIARKVGIQEGISMAQTMLYTCRFDAVRCKDGLSHLRQYRAKQDRRTGEYLEDPLHDQHSHAADAFRTLATGLKDNLSTDKLKNAYAMTAYDYFDPTNSGRQPNDQSDFEYDIFNPTGSGIKGF